MDKSYNPFKMWGSWAGFVLGILIVPLEDRIFLVNPISWFMSCGNAVDRYGCSVGYGLIALVTLPMAFFLYGWAIHSFFRKINKENRAYILVVLLLIVACPIVYSYIKDQQSFQATLNSADFDIQNAKVVADRTEEDLTKERLAMNAIMAIAKSEKDISQFTAKMLSIASDESIAEDVRLAALEALGPKVNTMSSGEKESLSDRLTTLSGQISGRTEERMARGISYLQKLLIAK